MFNSLLILTPVIAAQTLSAAFSGASFNEAPTLEAIDTTRRRMDEAFVELAPRNGADRYEFWHDIISRELAQKDVSAARGFLLAAPQMLARDEAAALRAAAESEEVGTEDERIAAAALRKLPTEVSLEYERARISERVIVASTLPADTETENVAETAAEGETVPPEEQSVAQHFARLGTFEDLANRSQQWVLGDRVDPFVLQITGVALINASEAGAGADSVVRAASILKSARRSRRMTPEFTRYLQSKLDDTLSESDLKPAIELAYADLVPTNVRVERVRSAFTDAFDRRALTRLEADLAQIDRIGELTSPSGAITLLETVRDGADLRRARLVAEAGGDRSIALAKQYRDSGALSFADTGVQWTRHMVLQVMGLTASGLVMFWVMLSTIRRNFRRHRKIEPPGLMQRPE